MDKETNNLISDLGVQGAVGLKCNPSGVEGDLAMFGPRLCDRLYGLKAYHDYPYLALLRRIKSEGRKKGDRTGTGTTAIFGHQMRFSLLGGVVPLLTSKKMFIPAIVHEIIWYLSGSSNIKYLQDNGVRIWNEWADANGDLGPVYGFQWRNWPTYEFEVFDNPSDEPLFYVKEGRIDQIANLIHDLKNSPDSRRLMVTAWNVGQLQDMKLPPCHYTFQFYSEEMTQEERMAYVQSSRDLSEEDMWEIFSGHDVEEILEQWNAPKRYLSCMLSQRSADAFLGVPFNIAQYSILTHLFAKLTGMVAKDFIWNGGDCHIYDNLQDQVNEQLSRTPYASPKLKIADTVDNIDNLKYNDFEFIDYEFHPAIKGQVAV